MGATVTSGWSQGKSPGSFELLRQALWRARVMLEMLP
jgi:hypothetical protein